MKPVAWCIPSRAWPPHSAGDRSLGIMVAADLEGSLDGADAPAQQQVLNEQLRASWQSVIFRSEVAAAAVRKRWTPCKVCAALTGARRKSAKTAPDVRRTRRTFRRPFNRSMRPRWISIGHLRTAKR